MNPISALIASTGLCSARAFLPAFAAACMLRFGAEYEVVREASANLIGTGSVATWFTSDWCLIVLGALAALEFAAQRSHDARALLAEIDHYAKPVMGAVTAFGLMSASDADFVNQIAPQQAGVIAPVMALVACGATFAVASARNAVLAVLHDADSENATGVHSVVAWAEDAYAALGMLLFVLFPLFMAVVIGLGIGVVLLLQRRAHAREEATRVPCASCKALIYRSAMRCPACKAASAGPCCVNWLGVATTVPVDVADPAAHAFRLLTKRRCPACATRLSERTPRQACTTCACVVFSDAAAGVAGPGAGTGAGGGSGASLQGIAAYDERLRARLLPTLAICALLGLVPVAGLIAGVLFYRVHLIAPYRAYVPRARSLLIRWGLRVVLFVLLALQIVPGVGVVLLPLMVLLNYLVFRKAFLGLAG
ncbi:MAG: DUF4126 family protein [Phycisphaerales bacterium]